MDMEGRPRRLARLIHVVHRYFIWLLVGSYVVAAALPQLGLWVRHATLGNIPLPGGQLEASLPVLMLASLLFNAGLGVRVAELRNLVHGPSTLLAGLAANPTLPVTYIFIISQVMRLWHNAEEAQQILVGLALVASMPIAGSSTAWTQNANGNLALSIGLVLFTTILSPLTTPLVLHAVGLMTTGDYSKDLQELASGGVDSFLGAWVILPSLLGVATRWLTSEQLMGTVQPYLKIVNWAVLLLLNYSNASLSLPKAVAHPDVAYLAVTLVLAVSLCGVAFSVGWGIAQSLRADRAQKVSIMFALGMNNNGAGLVLASVALADHPQVMLPIIFYNLVQHLVAATVDYVLFRHPAQPPG